MKTFPTIVLLLFFASVASSQEQDRDSTSTNFGIRFLFDGFRPSGGLGAKLWLSKASAIAVNITGQVDKYNYSESSSLSQSITFFFDYEFHQYFLRQLTIFGVISPNIGFSQESYSSSSYSYNNKYTTIGIGVGWGVEYRVADNLSFSASQTINYRQRLSSTENRNFYSGYIGASYLMVTIYL